MHSDHSRGKSLSFKTTTPPSRPITPKTRQNENAINYAGLNVNLWYAGQQFVTDTPFTNVEGGKFKKGPFEYQQVGTKVIYNQGNRYTSPWNSIATIKCPPAPELCPYWLWAGDPALYPNVTNISPKTNWAALDTFTLDINFAPIIDCNNGACNETVLTVDGSCDCFDGW
jgi:hypothetical protein